MGKEKRKSYPHVSDERFLEALKKLGTKGTSVEIRKALKLGSYFSPAIWDAGLRLIRQGKVTVSSTKAGKRKLLCYSLRTETPKQEPPTETPSTI